MTRLNDLGKLLRLLPYAIFATVGALIFLIHSLSTGDLKELSLNLFSDTLFFFIAFIFIDIVRALIQNRESKYLEDYIKNRISNDIFVALYFQKKSFMGIISIRTPSITSWVYSITPRKKLDMLLLTKGTWVFRYSKILMR